MYQMPKARYCRAFGIFTYLRYRNLQLYILVLAPLPRRNRIWL